MAQRLASFYIGKGEGRSVSVRSRSLPTESVADDTSGSRLPLQSLSSNTPNVLSQTSSQPWKNSTLDSQTKNMASGWRPMSFSQTLRPKSKQREDPKIWDHGQTLTISLRYRQRQSTLQCLLLSSLSPVSHIWTCSRALVCLTPLKSNPLNIR